MRAARKPWNSLSLLYRSKAFSQPERRFWGLVAVGNQF